MSSEKIKKLGKSRKYEKVDELIFTEKKNKITVLKIVLGTQFKCMHYAKLKTRSRQNESLCMHTIHRIIHTYSVRKYDVYNILALYFYKCIHQKHKQVNRFTV